MAVTITTGSPYYVRGTSGYYRGTLYAVSNEFGASSLQVSVITAPANAFRFSIGML